MIEANDGFKFRGMLVIAHKLCTRSMSLLRVVLFAIAQDSPHNFKS